MKKLTALFFSVLFSVVAWSAPSEGTHVVALFENQSPEVVARFHGVGRIRTWHRFLNGRWGALSGFSCSPNANQLARLAQDTRVFVVESNAVVTAFSQTIPTGVRRIGCQSNTRWINSTTTPIDVDVAVLDTGIDLTHPDLNVWQNVSFTGTATGNDDNGHGSHCAGIIGAQNNGIGVVGVAPGCRLWAVKVLGSSGSGSISQVISGFDYVVQHASEIEVASMSLGGAGYFQSLQLAIQNCVAKGVVVVAAAGNDTMNLYGLDHVLGTSDDEFPGCYPECLTVSALCDTDGIEGGLGPDVNFSGIAFRSWDDARASFSNWSEEVDSSKAALGVVSPGGAVDVAAPGVNIYSTYMNGGYATMSGTSMACPHVAGAVALYIAANARATTAAGVYAIRQAIIDAAIPMKDWGRNFEPQPTYRAQFPEPLVWVGPASTRPTTTISTPPYYPFQINGYGSSITLQATTDGVGPIKWWGILINDSTLAQMYTTNFGIGTSVALTGLPDARYMITATSTNASGQIGGAYSRFVVHTYPTTPTVSITTPTDGSTVADTDAITFLGTAADGVTDLSSRLSWTSSIDGQLGTGATFVGSLSAGSHTITASVTNSAGSFGSHAHSVTVTGTTPNGHPPSVTITSPSNGASYPQGTTVPIYGNAYDQEDGDLSSTIQWNGPSGLFATGSIASTNGLPVGTSTITASVRDSAGAVATSSRTVTITGAGTPLTVTVTTDKANYSNKMKALITVTVKSAGVAVSGAIVTVNVRGASGKTSTKTGLTTSAAGTASYYFNINRGQLGAGTATVSANASKTGYVAGTGSTTFTVN